MNFKCEQTLYLLGKFFDLNQKMKYSCRLSDEEVHGGFYLCRELHQLAGTQELVASVHKTFSALKTKYGEGAATRPSDIVHLTLVRRGAQVE